MLKNSWPDRFTKIGILMFCHWHIDFLNSSNLTKSPNILNCFEIALNIGFERESDEMLNIGKMGKTLKLICFAVKAVSSAKLVNEKRLYRIVLRQNNNNNYSNKKSQPLFLAFVPSICWPNSTGLDSVEIRQARREKKISTNKKKNKTRHP